MASNRISSTLRTFFLTGSLLCSAACIPFYDKNSIQTSIEPPLSFSAKIATNQDIKDHWHAPWWESFQRDTLSSTIENAFEKNQNIAQALAILEQANALVTETQSERLPQINVNGDLGRSWRGSDPQRGTGAIGTQLDWEVDIWNKIGAAARADRAIALAREEDLDALKLSLSAEIATTYFHTVAARQRLSLLEEQLRLDKELENLLQLRFQNGVGTSVDVLRQKARVADSETLIPLAEADLEINENRLDVLLGQMPDGKHRVPENETLEFMTDLPFIDVPASLLFNRPDLRAAKAELVAADAEIESAIADRFPGISLTGAYEFVDSAAYNGPLASLMGSFVQPLLDWGQRKAAVERNKSLYRERLAAYTQRFLEAAEDVENALIREQKQRIFLERLDKQRQILQDTAKASENRYAQGIDDYLPVIDALQELRDIERSLIEERTELVNIRIDLFRAIGGPIYKKQNLTHQNDDEEESKT